MALSVNTRTRPHRILGVARSLIPLLLAVIIPLNYLPRANATIFSPRIENCHVQSAGEDSTKLVNFTRALAQIVPANQAKSLGLNGQEGQNVLRIDLFGKTGQEITGFDNVTGKLATMFTETHDLNYNLWSTTTYICNSLFPPSPLPEPYIPRNTTYCPLPAGDLGINISVPLTGSYGLSTLRTQVRIVDTSIPANELSCINIDLSPYYPDAWYWDIFLWIPAGLAIGYWIASWAARFAAGWVVGRAGDGSSSMDHGETRNAAGIGSVADAGGDSSASRISRKWGTMLYVEASHSRSNPIPDVIWHLQFCAVLAMIAVDWPEFAYPIFAQGAWASLLWNVTLAQGTPGGRNSSQSYLIDPLQVSRENPFPRNYLPQGNDTAYPLYLNQSIPNMFFNDGASGSRAQDGIERFATAIGLRNIDLFGVCLVLFLSIAGAVIVLSLLFWFMMALVDYIRMRRRTSIRTSPQNRGNTASGATAGYTDADISTRYKNSIDAYGPETPGSQMPILHDRKGSGSTLLNLTGNQTNRRPSALKRVWGRFKVKGPIGAFHWAALCGNLVRLIVLFHLPITIFSTYQWTIQDFTSVASVVLAGLAFAFFSVALPVFLLYRIFRTPTAKLYDAMRTLLALGPMYNIYAQGNQLYYGLRFLASLVTGITIGVGQGHGLAQAIVLLVVEIAFGLGTTIWHPWRAGAGMVIPGFLFAMIRILSAALLVVMAPNVSLSRSNCQHGNLRAHILLRQLPVPNYALGWIAYAVLLLQGIALLFFLIMLVCKILEGLIRLFGKIPFDESTHPLDGGLFAAFGGLSAKLKGGQSKRPKMNQRVSSNVGSINTQMMLNRYSTNQTAVPFSGRASLESFHSRRPSMNQWGEPNGVYSPVPDHDAPQEVLMDSAPSRGFSVLRGGRAVYQDPYAALPNVDNANRITYPPNSRSLTSPDRRTTFAPLPPLAEDYNRGEPVSPSSRPIRHVRTRSQTAVIETFAPAGALGLATPSSGAQGPSFSVNRGNAPPIPLILQSQHDASQAVDADSLTSVYGQDDEEETPRKSNKPSNWFGRSKTNVNLAGSDSEEELHDIGLSESGKAKFKPASSKKKSEGKGHGGNSSSGGWLAALLPGASSRRDSVEMMDDVGLNENAARAGKVALGGDDGPERHSMDAPLRSFKVKRQSLPSSTSSHRPSPQSSNPTTPHAFTSANLSNPSSPTGSEPPLPGSQKSFVVQRANRSAGPSASSSRVTTPGNEPPPPFSALTPINPDASHSENAAGGQGRSFVVQRANRNNPNLAPPAHEPAAYTQARRGQGSEDYAR
ncbi:hypothetical protein QFC22_002393 [Naganishia vaughanmartiniae]|uniref:Uncharacterized protein n=1 Tax=Naganishia vaughanmartiniae TaxID=1424756 RepID=A0ACC2XEF8_9TREE|nr:hypothetical protein QFC22_002393 [Naganishia vaughanmartiniae]